MIASAAIDRSKQRFRSQRGFGKMCARIFINCLPPLASFIIIFLQRGSTSQFCQSSTSGEVKKVSNWKSGYFYIFPMMELEKSQILERTQVSPGRTITSFMADLWLRSAIVAVCKALSRGDTNMSVASSCSLTLEANCSPLKVKSQSISFSLKWTVSLAQGQYISPTWSEKCSSLSLKMDSACLISEAVSGLEWLKLHRGPQVHLPARQNRQTF